MKKYDISDLMLSNPEKIAKGNAIVFVYNGSSSYMSFFSNAIRCVPYLCDAEIIIVKPKALNIEHIVKHINNKIHTIDLESTIPKDIIRNKQAFQFLKPYAIKYIYANRNRLKINKILYIDIDTMLIRNIGKLFDAIKTNPLVVKELGVDIEKYGYSNYVNDPIIDEIFNIKKDNKIQYPTIHCNTGVLGFDFTRKLDTNLINKWALFTSRILSENLIPHIKWWDQGVFNLAIEYVGAKHILSNNRNFNHTVLPEIVNKNFNMSFVHSNIVHFIGESKPNLSNILMNKKIHNNLDISLCGHKPVIDQSFQSRKYLTYRNLNTLPYSDKRWSNNSLGESRIFLADQIFDDEKDIWGCLTASFNQKYFPFKVDHINNYIDPNACISNKNKVFCTSLCLGNRAARDLDLWHKNFQHHFRNLYKDSEFVQDKIEKITGMIYDPNNLAPYANQIICHKDLFRKLSNYIKSIIDLVFQEFSENFIYPNIPDNRRSLAYVMEEITMLWWSNQKDITYESFCKPNKLWYEEKQFLNT